jgi:hypothetical protein
VLARMSSLLLIITGNLATHLCINFGKSERFRSIFCDFLVLMCIQTGELKASLKENGYEDLGMLLSTQTCNDSSIVYTVVGHF